MSPCQRDSLFGDVRLVLPLMKADSEEMDSAHCSQTFAVLSSWMCEVVYHPAGSSLLRPQGEILADAHCAPHHPFPEHRTFYVFALNNSTKGSANI